MNTKQKQVRTKAKKTATKRPPLHVRARSHAKHVLVPHKANDYHPHLIRAHGLIAVLVIALLAQVLYSVVTTGKVAVLGRASDIQVVELLDDTNAERTKAGLEQLQINSQLSDAAFLKAQNMLAEQYWAHVSPSGIEPWKWFADSGYNYSFAGENLAKNYPTAQATVDAWMNSPTHRENILKKEYVDVGFAVVDGELNGEQTTLVVALYGAPVTVVVVESRLGTEGPTFATSTVEVNSSQPIAYFGAALASLSPVTIVILGLLAVVALVGAATHHHREKLPKPLKKTWRSHRGLYTVIGTIAVGVAIIFATGTGSI